MEKIFYWNSQKEDEHDSSESDLSCVNKPLTRLLSDLEASLNAEPLLGLLKQEWKTFDENCTTEIKQNTVQF